MAHRARRAAGVPAEKFEEIIKQGREQITAQSDRVTAKLIKAGSATRRPGGKPHRSSSLRGLDDQGPQSTHAQCVSLADLNSCWNDHCVAATVHSVVQAALCAPNAPKLPTPEETKELSRRWIEVPNNSNGELETVNLHKGVFGKTPKEIPQVKIRLSKPYHLLEPISLTSHDEAGAA